MKILCNIITDAIRDLSKQLGLSESFTCNLVSVWQTQNNTVEYPTVTQLKELITSSQKDINDIALAIPNYTSEPFSVGKSLASTSREGNIVLRLLPKENPIEYFFDYIQGKLDNETSAQKKKVFSILDKQGYSLSELKNTLTSTKEIYQFLLWHEMSHLQNSDRDSYWKNGKDLLTEDKIAIEVRATKDAWDKARKYASMRLTDVTLNVYNTPNIGVEVLDINYDNPIARLAKDFSAIERYDRVVMLARNFTNIVDRAVEKALEDNASATMAEMAKDKPNIGELSRLYEKALILRDNVKGRMEVIQDTTLEQIFTQMREEIESYLELTAEELDEDYGEGKGEYLLNAYQKILDNWEALLDEACVIIEGNENIRVVTNKHTYNNGATTKEVVGGYITESTQESDLNNEAFDDDEEGDRVDGNGGWSFKVRFIDPRTTLSKGVKKVLSNIKREGVNGELETDDLGNIKYLNSEFAHAALINELSNMVDANDFSVKHDDGTYSFPALEKAAKKYSWVKQVINALQTEPNLISSFYADFRKDFIPYWMQYYSDEKGKWVTKALNQSVALDSTKNSIINNFEQGTVLDKDSIYDTGKKLSTHNASVGINLTDEVLPLLREFDEDDYTEITDKSSKILRMIGLNSDSYVISNLLKSENGILSLDKVLNSAKNIFDGIKNLPEGAHLIDEFSSDYDIIAKEVGLVSELDNIQSFRAGDKTYYSYSAPNYLDTMFKVFKNDERRDTYLQDQFGKYSWFKDESGWRNEWLHLIDTDEDVRYKMSLKELNNINGVEYTKWEPLEIKAAFIREYFSVGYNKGSQKQFAWYNMPIFSDSPVTKFIKFLRYTDNFEEQLIPLFRKVVKQELSRIKLVLDRWEKGVSPIENFDITEVKDITERRKGYRFHFFPELNSYNNGTFQQEAMKLIKEKDLDGLNNLIDSAIKDIMDVNFKKSLKENFTDYSYEELKQSLLDDGTITSEDNFEMALKEYFWNQAYATTQIIQLTTTDLAFYKNEVDFQKRFKEVYAAGTKLNTNSFYGRDIERTIYLKDQIITSSSYQDIKISLNRAVEAGHIQSFDRDAILHKFKDVNVADAQAYRSLSSMRAVLDMMGAWTPEMQNAMDRFKEGQWNMADFNIVWQTIKPFVFTQIEKPDGLGGSIKVPHQNKNSEFLLLAMYQMVANSMGKSNKLSAINRFMEDNNIDVIQFESSVKVGKQGIIDLRYSEPKLQVWTTNNSEASKSVEEAAKLVLKDKYAKASIFDRFKAGNDYLLDKDKISQKEYNDRFESIEPEEQEIYDLLESLSRDKGEFKPEVVHEIPYSDYVIQQPTPEHLFDHKAVFGSQFRNLIIADMPDDPNFRVIVNGKSFTKQEIVKLYQSNIVENLLEDWTKIKSKYANIRALQKSLLDTVKGNPKYGRDMLDALQIVEIVNPITNKREEVFNIPLDNPSTTNKIQELITSMFKNAITKQDIKGASCILVSNFGFTKELSVLHGKNGEIIGMECYLPAYSKQFYEPFMVTKIDDEGKEYQELDIDKMPMELRKLIGYRIPTEDKYSMAPLIVKGFLPQQNGSSIMLPADITQIAGSDFDVDKMFLMIPEFKKINNYNIKEAWNTFYKEHPETVAKIDSAQWKAFIASYEELLKTNPSLAEEIDVEDEEFKNWFVKNSGLKNYQWVQGTQDEFAKWFKMNKSRFYKNTDIIKVSYDFDKAPKEQSREARNNILIDIAYGILTHPDTAEKIHNPGNFDKAKIAARIATIISSPNMIRAFANEYGLSVDSIPNLEKVRDTLLKISREGRLDELDDFVSKHRTVRSQLTIDTFIYNHKQNMTGGALIGMYANNTTMQAKFQFTNLAIKEDYTFIINGRRIQSLHDIISPIGERISKNCANFSAASVDNVKDPVLADLMQNTNTANIAGFMLRAGMSIEEIGLMFSQPIIVSCITDTGGLEKLESYIGASIKILESNGGSVNTDVRMHNFTSEELIMNALNEAKNDLDKVSYNEHLASQIQAATLMHSIIKIAQDLSDLTQISRADSPNGAINTSIAGAKVQTQKVNVYIKKSKLKTFTLAGITDIMQNNFITVDMSVDQMREKLLKSKMPMLQAFYSLGIELASSVMGKYFSHTTKYSDDLVEQLNNNSPKGIISENILNNFYNGLIEFALSKTKLFGDDENSTFDNKRNYYLHEYYKDYLTTLAANPDIAKMSIFKKIQVTNRNEIIMKRSGRLTPMMRDTLMRDFDMLLYSNNPSAQKLAIDLFMYSYYKDGFKFGPNSFGTFFSSNFISSFPEVVSTLRSLRYDMQSGSYFDNYLPQFYANHWNRGIVPRVPYGTEVIETSDGQIAVDAKKVINKNLLYSGKIKSYPFIIYNKQVVKEDGSIIEVPTLYSLSLDGSDRVIYTPSVTFSGEQQDIRGVKYNANMTASEIAKIEPVKVKSEPNKITRNTSLEFDENLFKSIEEAFSGFENTDFDNLENDYSEALGEAELNEPLCKTK